MALVSPTPILHVGKSGGMDYSTPPHLLDEQKWRLLRNVRQSWSLEQVPRLLELVSVGSTSVQNLAAVSGVTSNRGLWLAWGSYYLYQLTSASATVIDTNVGNPWGKLSLWKHNNVIFYCSNSQPKYTDGGQAYNVWHDRSCFTKHNTTLAIGDGAFAKEPFYTGDTFVGDLGQTFTWTTGEQYRVYLTNARLFQPLTSIKIERTWCDEEVPPVSSVMTLTGTVLETQLDYCVVEATNTVAGVPNYGPQLAQTVSADPPWLTTATDVPTVPAGRYCAVFFDHLVVVGLTNDPNSIAWSDVNNYSDFIPRSDNEADFYVCTEHQRSDDFASGVTGVQMMGDSLLIFTPSCVYQMTYTGLPRVMHVRPLIKDVGNGLPHATAGLADSVVWFDIHHGSFFQFSQTEGLQNIGGPITEWFVAELSTDPAEAQEVFSFVDRESSEVGWQFIADDGGWKAVVYNYSNKTWSTRTAPVPLHSYSLLPERALSCSELTAPLSSYLDTFAVWDASEEPAFKAQGGASTVYTTTFSGSPVMHDSVLMETGDLLYGTLEGVKEVSRIMLAAAGTFTGIKVEVSARNAISDAVTYVNCGTWTPTTTEKALTFPAQAGRVLRYRFTPQGDVKNFVFYGYEDNVVQTRSRR